MTQPTTIDTTAFRTTPHGQRVEKPWGHELIFVPSDLPYCGKLLHLKAGHRMALQVHEEKTETIVLLQGEAKLQIEDAHGALEELTMAPLVGYTFVPGQRHRLIAVADCDFFEASTAELGATRRLEDDYGRADETEAMRRAQRATGD